MTSILEFKKHELFIKLLERFMSQYDTSNAHLPVIVEAMEKISPKIVHDDVFSSNILNPLFGERRTASSTITTRRYDIIVYVSMLTEYIVLLNSHSFLYLSTYSSLK